MSVLDRFRLDGKVAVVTGASSGLGVAFSKALAEAGADVVLGARRVERLADTGALVTAAGRKFASLQTDVTQPEQCDALIAHAIKEEQSRDTPFKEVIVVGAQPIFIGFSSEVDAHGGCNFPSVLREFADSFLNARRRDIHPGRFHAANHIDIHVGHHLIDGDGRIEQKGF